jgi:hypothetical protein
VQLSKLCAHLHKKIAKNDGQGARHGFLFSHALARGSTPSAQQDGRNRRLLVACVRFCQHRLAPLCAASAARRTCCTRRFSHQLARLTAEPTHPPPVERHSCRSCSCCNTAFQQPADRRMHVWKTAQPLIPTPAAPCPT